MSDTAGSMTAWDRVADRYACETFVFTVIAVHLGLRAEDRYRHPWSEMASGIVGASIELWELWEARRFWSRHAGEVVDELHRSLAACPPQPAPDTPPNPKLGTELLDLAAQLQAQAATPATSEHGAGLRAGLDAAIARLTSRADPANPSGSEVSSTQLVADLGLPPEPTHYRWNEWHTLEDPDRPSSATRREDVQLLVRKWMPDIDPEICAAIAEEIDALLPPVEDIIRERQRLNPHEHTITNLINEIEDRLGYMLFEVYDRTLIARALEAEATKLTPTHTGAATEFTRGYDQALTHTAGQLRHRAHDLLPPFPISEIGRHDNGD
ncbi:hypothetical protein [Pseudonocardia acaciae]|uniref:hypothetical protein n=1 Tax=Pseudonocardia acaciae TaxID=551276 RepID=UPI000AACC8FE|nr:hypothetical protein [Pseudonocardia acaciae]